MFPVPVPAEFHLGLTGYLSAETSYGFLVGAAGVPSVGLPWGIPVGMTW